MGRGIGGPTHSRGDRGGLGGHAGASANHAGAAAGGRGLPGGLAGGEFVSVCELALKYYPRLWDRSRLEALAEAGRLTAEELEEIMNIKE